MACRRLGLCSHWRHPHLALDLLAQLDHLRQVVAAGVDHDGVGVAVDDLGGSGRVRLDVNGRAASDGKANHARKGGPRRQAADRAGITQAHLLAHAALHQVHGGLQDLAPLRRDQLRQRLQARGSAGAASIYVTCPALAQTASLPSPPTSKQACDACQRRDERGVQLGHTLA